MTLFKVDPYDGTGNGPTEYKIFVKNFPEVRLIRQFLRPDMEELSKEKESFDAIYSISVLEHVPLSALEEDVFPAIKMYLRPQGLSIHAIDMVRKGIGDKESLSMLLKIAELSEIPEVDVMQGLEQMDDDVETYYLSAEGHNLWRNGILYEKFPMRKCTSMQVCARYPLTSVYAQPSLNSHLSNKASEFFATAPSANQFNRSINL